MHPNWITLALACLLPATGVPASTPAPDTAASEPQFSDFRIIPERNIFNANRSAARTEQAPVRETPRAPRIDSITLLGTLSYENGQFAYFDGSDPAYRTALEANESIAGGRLRKVKTDGVVLEIDGQVLDLKVGMGLRREDDGAWTVSKERPPASPSASRPSGTSRTESSTSNNDTDDVLKRLMQQREQELE
ncbi:MAG TPA: hypothetical protein VMS21_10600 [Methylomirabilota bacterium]|nr:hypothetical protein [Methylomirabilota bacterium]